MVIDTSAIVAIIKSEPERETFLKLIEGARARLMSVVSLVETTTVVQSRFGQRSRDELDAFIDKADISIVSVDLAQGEVARDAFQKFGKGHHPAGLNFGDCFSYALAITKREPLLFKGTDFGKTDVMIAAEV